LNPALSKTVTSSCASECTGRSGLSGGQNSVIYSSFEESGSSEASSVELDDLLLRDVESVTWSIMSDSRRGESVYSSSGALPAAKASVRACRASAGLYVFLSRGSRFCPRALAKTTAIHGKGMVTPEIKAAGIHALKA